MHIHLSLSLTYAEREGSWLQISPPTEEIFLNKVNAVNLIYFGSRRDSGTFVIILEMLHFRQQYFILVSRVESILFQRFTFR